MDGVPPGSLEPCIALTLLRKGLYYLQQAGSRVKAPRAGRRSNQGESELESEYTHLSAHAPPGPALRWFQHGWAPLALALALLLAAAAVSFWLPEAQLDRLQHAFAPGAAATP